MSSLIGVALIRDVNECRGPLGLSFAGCGVLISASTCFEVSGGDGDGAGGPTVSYADGFSMSEAKG